MTPEVMNYCNSKGWLVGDAWPPPDAIDWDSGRLPVKGCSNLRCSSCGHSVRTLRGRELIDTGRALDVSRVYDSPVDADFRSKTGSSLYMCRCEYHHETSQHPLEEETDNTTYIGIYSWGCGGHVPGGLPDDVDGLRVTDDNAEELARKALSGWLPEDSDERFRTRGYWLARIYLRIERTPAATELLRVGFEYMEHPDLERRTRSLHFVRGCNALVGAWQATRLLLEQRALFAGISDSMSANKADTTLEHLLWRIALPLVASGRTRDLARADALDSARTSRALFDALAANDSAWFLDHLVEIAKASPQQLAALNASCRWSLPRPMLAEAMRSLEALTL